MGLLGGAGFLLGAFRRGARFEAFPRVTMFFSWFTADMIVVFEGAACSFRPCVFGAIVSDTAPTKKVIENREINSQRRRNLRDGWCALETVRDRVEYLYR